VIRRSIHAYTVATEVIKTCELSKIRKRLIFK